MDRRAARIEPKEVHVFLINKISNVQYHTSRLPAVQIDSKIIIIYCVHLLLIYSISEFIYADIPPLVSGDNEQSRWVTSGIWEGKESYSSPTHSFDCLHSPRTWRRLKYPTVCMMLNSLWMPQSPFFLS